MTVAAPAVEHGRQARGIGRPAPRLSWKVAAPPAWRQAGYELRLRSEVGAGGSGEPPRERLVTVTSAEQVLVAWPFDPLTSRETVDVAVRVRGSDGSVSDWSEATEVEAGLLDASDWVARPVGPAWPEESDTDRRPCLVRRRFVAAAEPVRARLYVSAHGLYEVEINGRRVGDDVLSPGWTVYQQRLRYYTYDVTDLVTTGDNIVGAWLGDGWYRGRLGFRGGHRDLYGADIGLIAQLELTYADGSREIVATDESWHASYGPILVSGLYDGESYDARLHDPDWSSVAGTAEGWSTVAVGTRDPRTLVAAGGPPVRQTLRLKPESVITTRSGRTVLDFGQNLVGRLRIRVRGAAGDVVTIRHAEVLQDGELYVRPLRGARATDEYVLAGAGVEEWEPRFTIHGFRYAELTSPPGVLDPEDVTAVVLHTDMERTGWFECSDPLLNRLHENVLWSMRGNFVDIPTDCPQRDERLGWTGDIQVFAPTASFLFDCAGMLTSWLADVAAEQEPDGTVPWYVPVVPGGPQWTPIRPGAGWGDVAVLTPWTLYQRFGDTDVLRRQYDGAQRWVDLVDRLAGEDRLWNTGMQLGDWLDPTAPPDDPAAAQTDPYLVATAYFAWSARCLGQTARVLGRESDAERYLRLADEVTAAFRRAYLNDDGDLTDDTPTAHALAIAFELVPDDRRAAFGSRLAALVRRNGNRISTGFLGTPLVCDALSATGQLAAAYDLLLQRECPSWLYTVVSGGTTIWERWDSLLPDGTVNPGQMTSFNHYALGSVADWMHRVIGGLVPTAPGYRSVLIKPQPGGGITSCRVRHETPYGGISVDWSLEQGEIRLEAEIPSGVDAVVELPGQAPRMLSPGVHRLSGANSDAA